MVVVAEFLVFALFICLSAMLLVIVPVMMHPTLPTRRKIIISVITFVLLVPLGLLLYAWLGVPQMAAN